MSVRFNTVAVDSLNVFYREAGDRACPTVLLLHGFPSASHMFRDLIRTHPVSAVGTLSGF